MLGITSTRNLFYHLRRQVRHNSRVTFAVPVGRRVGTVKEVCQPDSAGDVWVFVEFYEPAIQSETGTWLKATSVKVRKTEAA